MGFKDTSKYQDKDKPSFLNTKKYQFLDTSKYQDVDKPKKTLSVDKSRPSVVSGGRPLPVLDQKKLNKASGTAGAVTANLVDSATLGLATKGLNKFEKGLGDKALADASKGHKVASKVGEFAGYTVPFGAASKVAKPVVNAATKKISNQAAKWVVEQAGKGALEGAVVGGAEGAIKGKDAVQNAKTMALYGSGGNLVVGGAGKLIGKVLKPRVLSPEAIKVERNPVVLKRNLDVEASKFRKKIGADSATYSADKPIKSIQPTAFKGNKLSPTTSTEARIPIAEQVPSPAKDKFSFKNAYNKFYTRIVDAKNPLKPLGDDTYIKATNSKMVGGTVDHILTRNLVDKEGKTIGDSLKTIAESIPKESEKDFWIYSRQKHNIARATQNKPIYSDFTPEQSAAEVAKYEKEHPEWKDINNKITSWIDKFMNEWGVKSGVLDSKMYDELRKIYPDYIPTQREFSELEKGIPNVNGRGFVDQTSPIKSATGSDRGLTPTLENIMNLVNRTVRTARYNEVGQGLLKSIRENPSSIAEIIPEGIEINPNVKNIVTVLENGKPVNVKVNDKSLLEALQGMTKSSGDITNAAKKVSGVYKSLITQKNPIFAIRNIARDVPTYLTNSTENNPIKALGNLGGAVKDIVTNGEALNQYKALGGGGSNFFNSVDAAKSLKKLTSEPSAGRKILNGIEKFNNLTETAPRLAEFKKVLKETGDTQKALYASSDVTTNFSRGGDITKTVDAYVPYLNAGVQGLDKLARQFKNRPIATVLKGATVVTAPTLILDHMNKDNPNYQALDNRTKDNYFVFYYGDKPTDNIKLPKSRELGVLFGSLAERTLRKLSGQENSFKGFGTTVATNFSPTNPIENNLASPIINLKINKDFANRDIVPRTMKDQNLSGRYQYDEKTSELAKKIGEVTNLSPKQIDYIIKSYTGVIGQLSLPALTKSTYSGQGGANILKPITSQFTTDPLYSNQTLTDFYDNFDMLKQKAADRNFSENLPAVVKTKEEILKSRFTKAQDRMTDITKQIKQETDENRIRELRQKLLDIANNANKSLK